MSEINPRIDIAFKKLFGVEENKDLLISLINAVVDEEDEVADIILLNPYNLKNYENDKLSILDVKAKGVDGKQYNIEIQLTDQADYDKRVLYYWGRLYTEQLKNGEAYGKLKKTIGIHIMNFISILGDKRYHNIFRIKKEGDLQDNNPELELTKDEQASSGDLYFKDFEIHTIELSKFADNVKEDLTDIANKVKTSLDRWAAFLTKHNLLNTDKLPSSLDDTKIKKALDVLEIMNLNEEERQIYEGKMKWYRDELSMIETAKQKGLKKGLQQGLQQGKEEGLKQGLQKSKEEKKEIARKLLLKGLSREEVSVITGLDTNEF